MAPNVVSTDWLTSSVLHRSAKPLLWNLPNELTVRIWGICSPHEQLKMRQVCWQWKIMYRKFFAQRSKVMGLKLAVGRDQFYLYGWKLTSEKTLSLPRERQILIHYLKLTELVVNESEKRSGTLILEDEAANDEFLELILLQRWNIRRLELHGIAINVSNDKLCRFVSIQNDSPNLCDIKVFRVKHGIVNVGFVSDHLIKAFKQNDVDFDVELDDACAACLSRTSISNYALQTILRPNMRYRFQYPFACKISIPGLKKALEDYFFTDWEAQNMETSMFINENGILTTEKGYYSCELELHTNITVNLTSVALIELDGVEKHCFCRCGARLAVEHLDTTKAKRGKIFFRRCTNDQFLVAKIIVS